jgi:hypothetical protein
MNGDTLERRRERRLPRHFGVEFAVSGRKRRLGITRDASATGVLVNTLNRFALGEEVFLTIHSSPQTTSRVRAKIVRVEPMGVDARYPWRYATAARFEEPVWELENRAATVA